VLPVVEWWQERGTTAKNRLLEIARSVGSIPDLAVTLKQQNIMVFIKDSSTISYERHL